MPLRRKNPNTTVLLKWQLAVVDAEVVPDLVEHGEPHLVAQLLLTVARRDEGLPIDGDLVGEHHGVARAALPKRRALVQPERSQALTQLGRGPVLDRNGDVVQESLKAGRQLVTCLQNEAAKPP